jgi:NAD(P)-dependent dehydrogenase (short-subunit alcohol dehydrogenase family)
MKPVCLITGAGGRLGTDLCLALRDDYHVVATYQLNAPNIPSQHQAPLEGADDGQRSDSSRHDPIYVIQADLSRREDIQRLIEVTLARYGRIDALINSAADTKFHGHLRDLWQADDYPKTQMHLNSAVPIQLASAIYHYCWKDQLEDNVRMNRSVVNVSSISGLYVFKEANQAYYGVSKAALNMLTQYLSLEFSPYGVRVNAICPSQFLRPAATRRVTESIKELLTGELTGEIVTKLSRN